MLAHINHSFTTTLQTFHRLLLTNKSFVRTNGRLSEAEACRIWIDKALSA